MTRFRNRLVLLIGPLLLLAFHDVTATPTDNPVEPDEDRPTVAPASDEGRQAIARFRVPEGLKVELFAAEPLLANPVVFDIDDQGRFYVVETFRHSDGVTDTRNHMNWLDADLASRSVEDRVAMYKEYLKPEEFAHFSEEQDRIRLVEDRDGDGQADHATVFADGFHDPATGLAAGVLARGQDVYFACIPDLWLIRDENGDGRADFRKSLHHGYGVHVGFLGHDLHALTPGPDGKLYFSIGDRGFNVTTFDGQKLAVRDTGSVLRCNWDGTGLEVVATGLRNPQELAFDEFGNLFTVDNNSDSGDRARLVWIVEGGDSGWRIGFQFIQKPNSRGPWNAEKMWHPRNDDQPAFLVPPIANLSDGPSGLAYNPGTALRESDRGRFFLADFRGASGTSGVRSFAVKPEGASFTMTDQNQFLWGLEATDVAFGPDGALYVSDWVEGWNKTGKGRIYKLFHPQEAGDAQRSEVRKLLADGMDRRPVGELTGLLGHADQRVRREAQYALAARGTDEAQQTLIRTAKQGAERLARIHALWGLSQLKNVPFRDLYEAVSPLLRDPDAEIRVQALRALTWGAPAGSDQVGSSPKVDQGSAANVPTSLIPLLSDESPRVRFFAALAIAKLPQAVALEPVLAMICANADADAYLRHAGVLALSRFPDAILSAHADDTSAAVRLAILLAFRRHESPEVARFLNDAEARIVTEAARAIHDVPIDGAMSRLAAREVDAASPLPLLRRVVNANLRVGDAASALRLAALAGDPEMPEPIRVEALDALAQWTKPTGRDRVTGLWRPLPERPEGPAAVALASVIALILKEAPDRVRRAGVEAVSRLSIKPSAEQMAALVADADRAAETRVAALRALETLGDDRLGAIVDQALNDPDPRLRSAALSILARLDPARAIEALAGVLDDGSTGEKQAAFATLATLNAPEADALLARWLERLGAGKVATEIRLDLLEAASGRSSEEVRRKLAKYDSRRPEGDPVAANLEALRGGDAERGERIFREKAEVSCLRCHKIRGQGGEVGPELTGIGDMKPREYLLESIVAPNKQIAQGYETQVIATEDGRILAGIVKTDAGDSLTLMTAEGRLVTVPKSEIDEQRRGDSAMPQDLMQHLSRMELRDLIEFLDSLK